MNRNFFRSSTWPIVIALVFTGGYYFGSFFSSDQSSPIAVFHPSNSPGKLNQIIDYIDQEYVDSTNKADLIDQTIQNLLQKLDPHSYYISSSELQAMNEPLQGSFEGIGVQFSIQKDTIVVITPISGGPSEKVGIMAGDRIVRVDSQLVAGTGITNADVMRLLKGKGGTEVHLDIQRTGYIDLMPFDIVRGKIPIFSVDVGYMIDDQTGYIKISRFSRETYQEFRKAYAQLLQKGMQELILDLRGNGGGFMDAAINIADEFLGDGKLIVYTEGRARKRQDYIATTNSNLKNIGLKILIDESSASASEIVAGAIQDNDRGQIIGRRSFGKGLVQEQSSWPDGSATRLTIARYYTPSGRCIQKPYDNGIKAYHEELYDRYENGEFNQADSIAKNDSLAYQTTGGRIVYGGGGIMPDLFVPIDTSGGSVLLSKLYYAGAFYQFAFEYTDQHRTALLAAYNTPEAFVSDFRYGGAVETAFKAYVKKKKITIDESDYQASYQNISIRVRAGIGRNLYSNKAFYPIINKKDIVVKKALAAPTSVL